MFKGINDKCEINFILYIYTTIWKLKKITLWCLQDGAAFEKQSALFALAIADIIMINMWVLYVQNFVRFYSCFRF
jgi:hypothetical protein